MGNWVLGNRLMDEETNSTGKQSGSIE